MRVAVLTNTISRNAGGLFWSVRSLCKNISSDGCSVQVFAGEDQFSSEDKRVWHGVPLAIFRTVGPGNFGFQVGLQKEIDIFDPDIVHVHGLWTYPSLAAIRWMRCGKPCLVSPRGMLDPWALRNSGWKKRLAGLLYENAHLHGAACIHALCDSEYEAIRAYGLNNPVAVIPNGVDLPDLESPQPAAAWQTVLIQDSKVLFFLSRLHPKKGLTNLLHAWFQVKRSVPSANQWHLVIAGWDQGGHQAELEQLAAALGIMATVHFVGPQFDFAKSASFRGADAFILPSFSEGLPMAVLEAWSYGLPVIMTAACNLPEGFAADAAIRVDPELQSLTTGMTALFEMSTEERKACGKRGRDLVEQCFVWSQIGEQTAAVYRWVLNKGDMPSCVRLT
jgi:poly(glycerol-phosphate) alpha-glucosyltransferase